MRIGNSSIESLLYSTSNCINVAKSNHTALRRGLRPPFAPPTKPLFQAFIFAHTRRDGYSLGGCEYFHGSWNLKVCLEVVPWVPRFSWSRPWVQAPAAACVCRPQWCGHPDSPRSPRTVSHPGRLGTTPNQDWDPAGSAPLPRTGFSLGEWHASSVLLKKQALATFVFLCFFTSPIQRLKSSGWPGLTCALQAAGVLLGGHVPPEVSVGVWRPGIYGLEAAAELWVLRGCETQHKVPAGQASQPLLSSATLE